MMEIFRIRDRHNDANRNALWRQSAHKGHVEAHEDRGTLLAAYGAALGELAELRIKRGCWEGAEKECDELKSILRGLLSAYDEERQAIDISPDAGCIECTCGTVPNNLNTGLCAFHKARKAIEPASATEG